jgi:hypothetical protein
MDVELYGQLKRCHERGLEGYWGCEIGLNTPSEVEGICFKYYNHIDSKDARGYDEILDAILDIFSEECFNLTASRIPSNGSFRLISTVSCEEYYEIMDTILTEKEIEFRARLYEKDMEFKGIVTERNRRCKEELDEENRRYDEALAERRKKYREKLDKENRALEEKLDKENRALEEKLERLDRYIHLLVPMIDWVKGKDVNPIEDDNVIKILSRGYAIKHANIHDDSRGVLSMSITFELESKSKKGKF